MFRKIQSFWKKTKHKQYSTVNPEEIFLDSSNLPSFNRDQFEGRIETSISKTSLTLIKICFALIVIVFVYKVWDLQVIQGDFYLQKSLTNTLKKDIIFAHRGIIVDRNNASLVWNEESNERPYDTREYVQQRGFSHLLGFVKYPGQDATGKFYSFDTLGQDGLEKYFNQNLSGTNGSKLTETNVKGEIESQSILLPPQNGQKITLSIDSRVQSQFFNELARAVDESGFAGGAGVIMDTHTGEVLALVSYPDYSSEVMTLGQDRLKIKEYLESKRQPFLDRAISGLYAPGSIVKPFIALGILEESIIDPNKQILTEGFLSLPNPYDPEHPTIFKDWKNHGIVDMRKAIAVSSDVYFYITGGGFKNQKGLGISKIDEYMSKFFFGVSTFGFFDGPAGTIPTPEWKARLFDGEDWRIGNTYHTAIGQYGFQVTPLQIARAMTGIATEGDIVEPVITKDEQGQKTHIDDIESKNYKVVKEGMRQAVTNGTAIALNISTLAVAAKTGTAELGSLKQKVNSWVEGFFPYDNPRYTFAVVLENGPTTYKVSAMQVMGHTLKWMTENTPEYTK